MEEQRQRVILTNYQRFFFVEMAISYYFSYSQQCLPHEQTKCRILVSSFTPKYPQCQIEARRHHLANQIFKGLTASDLECCQCCGRKIGSGEVSTSCCMDPDQLSFLGPGIPLFFLYLRMIIFLLLLMAIIFSAFAAYSNYVTGDCTSLQVCSGDVLNLMSLINKRSSDLYMNIQGYLQLAFIIITIVFFQLLRANGRKLEKQCDEVIDSPSDYAVILRKLPSATTEQDVMNMIQERRKTLKPEEANRTENLKVVKVVLSYSLREYLKIADQNAQNFKEAIKQQRHDSFVPLPAPQPTNPSSIAIVVFQHQLSKQFLIHRPTLLQRFLQFFCKPFIPISELTVKGQYIGVERAPQPDDICWQNAGITTMGAICRRIAYGSIAVIILMIGGAAQYGLQVLYNSTQSSSLQNILTISNSLVILIFNSIIMLTLIATTKKQRNQTLTQFQNVLMVKQTIFQFFNAGIFVIGAEVAARSNKFTLNDGVCQQITVVMLANSFIPNLTLIFLNYTEFVNKLYIFLSQKGCIICTQQELNDLYLGPIIDFPSRYAYILKIVWLTGFYAPLVPVVVIISIVGLIINYLFEKILFAKSYSIPNTVSSMVYQNAVELLQYFLIAFSMGQFVVYFYFYGYKITQIPTMWLINIFLCIALGFFNLILPMDAINQILFPLPQSAKSEVKYSQMQEKFEVTYEMINPAYKTERERKNVKDILGLGGLIDEDKSKNIAYEMTNLFNNSLGNQNNITKQPLLHQNGIKHGASTASSIKQTQEGILRSIMNPRNNKHVINKKQYDSINNPQGKQQNPSINSQRIPNNNALNNSNIKTQNKDAPKPIENKPQENIISNKTNLQNSTALHQSTMRRTITNQSSIPNKNNTRFEDEQVDIGEGEKVNISINQPQNTSNQNKTNKKPAKPLQITKNEQIPAFTSNSSTKFMKMPSTFSQVQQRQKQNSQEINPTPQFREIIQNKPIENAISSVQEQPIRSAFINAFDDAPIGKRKEQISLSQDQSIEEDKGIYHPLPPNTDYQFQDPQKEKKSIYNPYLIEGTPQKTPYGKSYLRNEGIMNALGRPFTNFIKKMHVESLTQRPQKTQKMQKKP